MMEDITKLDKGWQEEIWRLDKLDPFFGLQPTSIALVLAFCIYSIEALYSDMLPSCNCLIQRRKFRLWVGL